VGVRSRSVLEPFKKEGIPTHYEKFTRAAKYSAWEFIFEPAQAGPAMPGTTRPISGRQASPRRAKGAGRTLAGAMALRLANPLRRKRSITLGPA
jgi:hypothetical protein